MCNFDVMGIYQKKQQEFDSTTVYWRYDIIGYIEGIKTDHPDME